MLEPQTESRAREARPDRASSCSRGSKIRQPYPPTSARSRGVGPPTGPTAIDGPPLVAGPEPPTRPSSSASPPPSGPAIFIQQRWHSAKRGLCRVPNGRHLTKMTSMDGVKPSRDLPRVALCRVPDTRQRYDLPSVILCPVPGTRQRVVCLVFMLCRVPRGQALGKEPLC